MSDAWTWALTTWARPGVEAICLDLQNRHGQCVPLLLWRLWAMQTGHAVPSDVLDAAASTARHWHTIAVVPLRAARKGLATAPDAIDEAGRLALLAQVRRAELEAERLLIDALERLLADTVSNAESPLDALMAVAGAWGATPPQDRLADLVRVIETPVG